tara:strand:+ start:635 stop:895 length:261 start_codon:yes stop_codon:yes gene_type:complete
MSRQLIIAGENTGDSSQKNILVVREDIINSWKWTEKIQTDINELRLEQDEMLKLIKRNEEIVRTIKEMLNKDDIIKRGRITENTNV